MVRRARWMRQVKEALERNEEIPADTECKRENSWFRMDRKKDAKKFYVRQYFVSLKFKENTMEKVKSWRELKRITLAPRGCEYNTPLNPQPKVLDGRVIEGEV